MRRVAQRVLLDLEAAGIELERRLAEIIELGDMEVVADLRLPWVS